jgi:hypothetical protein
VDASGWVGWARKRSTIGSEEERRFLLFFSYHRITEREIIKMSAFTAEF